MNTRHAAALELAAKGIPVFPCRVNGKGPVYKGSFHNATTDPTIINRWWAEADYNVAIEPERAGWAVIDLDLKGNGPANWQALPGDKPATYTVATPSGGLHLYYVGSLPASASKLAPGVDTRGCGSYVLVPPSVVDDIPYIVVDDRLQRLLPEWIGQALNTPTRTPLKAPEGIELDLPVNIDTARARLRDLVRAGDVAREGEGGDARTYQVAAEMADLGLSADVIHDLLCQLWNPHCLPPWDEDELRTKVENAWRYRQNDPGCRARSEGVPEAWKTYIAGHPPDTGPCTGLRVNVVRGLGGKPQNVEWLWPGWLPRGKLIVFGGEKGAGKSTLAYHILATITQGAPWPDSTLAPDGDILIWSAEDDWLDTIAPRLLAAGADMDHVYHVHNVEDLATRETHWFDPAHDMRGLLAAAESIPNLAAVLIDPIVNVVSGDSHKNAETRRGLQPLVDFAGERRAALIGITHFSKGTQGRSPIERINGSLAFGAVARVVWGAVKPEDEAAPRRFVRIASNIGPMGGAFEYTLEREHLPGEYAGIEAQYVRWGNYQPGSARQLIDDVQGAERQSEMLRAKGFLRELLEPAGSFGQPIADIRRAADAHSLSWATVRRAKDNLGGNIQTTKRGEATPPCWHWVWIDHDAEEY